MKSICQTTRYLRKVGQVWSIQPRSVTSEALSGVEYKDAKPFDEIPGPKGRYNIPLLGALFHFKPFTDVTFETMHRLYDRVMNEYGGSLVRIRLGTWTILVEDPVDIEVVMKNEGKYPHRMGFLINMMFCEKTGIPKSIGDLQGEAWQKYRSPLNARMMRAKSAQHYLPVQNEVADDLVNRLKRPFSTEDLMEIFYRYACESISVVAYNKRLGYLDPDIENHPEKLQALADIRIIFDGLNQSLQIPPFILKHFPLKLKKDYFVAGERLFRHTKDYYSRVMEEIGQQQKNETLDMEEYNFMLSLLMSGKLSADHMSGIATGLFTAGTDSTARNLQMVLYSLACNPDKQHNLYEEIISVIGPRGPLTEQALDKMKYLLACLKESFRLIHPTPSGTQRYLPIDIVLQGYRIPAGTSVMLMTQRTGKNPKYFPDPESFSPERWLRDEEGKRETPIPPSAQLPFGFGPRQCIGKRFAEQEIYLAVAKILQHFEVSLDTDQGEIELMYTPFAGSKDPIKFVFKERKQ